MQERDNAGGLLNDYVWPEGLHPRSRFRDAHGLQLSGHPSCVLKRKNSYVVDERCVCKGSLVCGFFSGFFVVSVVFMFFVVSWFSLLVSVVV